VTCSMGLRSDVSETSFPSPRSATPRIAPAGPLGCNCRGVCTQAAVRCRIGAGSFLPRKQSRFRYATRTCHLSKLFSVFLQALDDTNPLVACDHYEGRFLFSPRGQLSVTRRASACRQARPSGPSGHDVTSDGASSSPPKTECVCKF
jgi:hypothetical protein